MNLYERIHGTGEPEPDATPEPDMVQRVIDILQGAGMNAQVVDDAYMIQIQLDELSQLAEKLAPTLADNDELGGLRYA